MDIIGEAKLLRIFVGEDDKVKHRPLYEMIVKEARTAGLAGATAWHGHLGFGKSSRIRTSKVLDLSADLPMVIEIVDQESRIDAFIPVLDKLFAQADCGGLITLEKMNVIRYAHGHRE